MNKYVGISIFGWIIILGSIAQIGILIGIAIDWSKYESMLNYSSSNLVVARYSFSLFQRIVGLVVGIGIICGKEICRKILIFIGIFTISVLYWKHPYYFIENMTSEFILGKPEWAGYNIDVSLTALVATIMIDLWEIVFWGMLMFYFTRPKVKLQFH